MAAAAGRERAVGRQADRADGQGLGRLVGRAGRVVAARFDDERAVPGHYTLSLHDALPIFDLGDRDRDGGGVGLEVVAAVGRAVVGDRVAEAVGIGGVDVWTVVTL